MKKLKLLFLITAVACMAVPATAQVSFAVKGGLNVSNYYGEDADDFDMQIGFNAGIMGEYGFANNFCLQSGLMVHSKGAKSEYDASNPIYLQMPLHVGYKVNVSPTTKVVLHAGPHIAYGIAGKLHMTEPIISEDFFSLDDCSRFDAGAGFGVGTEFGNFLLDLGVDMGLMSVFNKRLDLKFLSSYLSVGYRF